MSIGMTICLGLLPSSISKLDAAKIVIVLEICTMYKTIIYFMLEIMSGFEYTKHNHVAIVILVALLSLPWIIVPGLLAKTILDRISSSNKKKN